MSIDFFAFVDTETLAEQPVTITCHCGTAATITFATRAEANTWSDARCRQPLAERTPLEGCSDEYCLDGYLYPQSYSEWDDLSVNMSNRNAKTILEVLGLFSDDESGQCGTVGAEDLLGRILVAQAINPADAGIPATQDGNIIECGRPEGYMDERLNQLAALAECARENHLAVAWS